MKSPRIALTASAAALIGLLLASPAAARTEIANAAQPQLAASAEGKVWLVYGRVSTPPDQPTHGGEHAKGEHPKGETAKGQHAKSKGDHAKAADGQHGGKGGGHGKAKSRPEGDVFVARSDDGGATFAPAVKVATLPNLMIGNRRGPRIVAHRDRLTLTVIGHELLAFTSTDGGKSWSEPVTINSVPASAHEGLHDLAAAPNGELFVTWLDERNGKMELWGASSNDGGRKWGANQQVYRSPDKSICECCHPSALFDAAGNLGVMWRNSIDGERDMWLTTRPKGAKHFTAPRKLGEGTWKINGCPHDGGEIVALGGGKFGAVWQREGEVFAFRSDGAETRLGQGKQPVAVAGNGQMLVVWQQGTDLMAVRDLRGSAPAKHASDARFPAVVPLPGGKGTLLAYESGPARGGSVIVERL
jgi:hypothetical protein